MAVERCQDCVGLKSYDQAANALKKAYATREINMYVINSDPAFDPLRSDIRVKALIRKMNFD
jgi:hypothetical protein